MTDRELLELLVGFIKRGDFIAGDEAGVLDMVKRYQHPPLTMHYRVAMRMTVNEYNELARTMKQIEVHLKETEHADPQPV